MDNLWIWLVVDQPIWKIMNLWLQFLLSQDQMSLSLAWHVAQNHNVSFEPKKLRESRKAELIAVFFSRPGPYASCIYIYISIYDKFTLGPLCYHKQPACGWCMPVYYWDDSSLGSLANESIFRTFGTPKTSPDFLTDFLIGGDWNMFYFSIYWE